MIDVLIDKLTNSIQEVATGRMLETAVVPASRMVLKSQLGRDLHWPQPENVSRH